MVKHIILWKLKSELSDAQKAEAKAEAKKRLESLAGNIPGLQKIQLNIDGLASSSADMMLDTEFDNAESLAGYQVNPLHVAAATYVRGVVELRLCLDYEI